MTIKLHKRHGLGHPAEQRARRQHTHRTTTTLCGCDRKRGTPAPGRHPKCCPSMAEPRITAGGCPLRSLRRLLVGLDLRSVRSQLASDAPRPQGARARVGVDLGRALGEHRRLLRFGHRVCVDKCLWLGMIRRQSEHQREAPSSREVSIQERSDSPNQGSESRD
eukprot:2518866-Prymnesium_polylepis.1